MTKNVTRQNRNVTGLSKSPTSVFSVLISMNLGGLAACSIDSNYVPTGFNPNGLQKLRVPGINLTIYRQYLPISCSAVQPLGTYDM